MGNNASQSSQEPAPDESEREMRSARTFSKCESETGSNENNDLRSLNQLWQDCRKLKSECQILADTITEIFEDVSEDEENEEEGHGEEMDESNEASRPKQDEASKCEVRLQDMVRTNQTLIGNLIKDLEVHAKLVCTQSLDVNEKLMIVVRELVSILNAHMAMLICNIRKLKRLITEMAASESAGKTSTKYPAKLSLPSIVRKASRPHRLVYDVISDLQDVDAMLLQLQQSQGRREELEQDIITVLACWKDFQSRSTCEEASETKTEPEAVLAAADSVARGLEIITNAAS